MDEEALTVSDSEVKSQKARSESEAKKTDGIIRPIPVADKCEETIETGE